MKKFTFLAMFLIAMVSMALAQTNMFVWMDGIKTTYPIALVDSVTFGDDDAPIGGIGTFSVSATKQVTFSPGNLQYHPANNEWRFAERQTDYIGEANSNISSTYNGWLDLFGWSTSATNFGVSTSTNYNDYSGSFVDWGTNKIGSDAPNTWRTLTNQEWEYLLNTRPNASTLKGVAQVNGVNGLVFLPDNWTCPEGVTFKSGFHSSYGVDYYAAYQTFTSEQWSKLEAAGAVFLPAAGGRDGSSVYDVQLFGYYWSAIEYNSNYARYLNFSSGGACMGLINRNYGRSVRLVKDVNNTIPEPPVEPETEWITIYIDTVICEYDLPFNWHVGDHTMILCETAGTYTHEEIVEDENYIYHYIFTLELTVLRDVLIEYDTEKVTICASELPYFWVVDGEYGQYWVECETAGTYEYIESLECGRAIYTLKLEVLEEGIVDTIWVEAYNSYEWHGKVYTESGTYIYENFCSIEVLELTIIDAPTPPEPPVEPEGPCSNIQELDWKNGLRLSDFSAKTWYKMYVGDVKGSNFEVRWINDEPCVATWTTAYLSECLNTTDWSEIEWESLVTRTDTCALGLDTTRTVSSSFFDKYSQIGDYIYVYVGSKVLDCDSEPQDTIIYIDHPTEYATICEGDEFYWRGWQITEAGTHTNHETVKDDNYTYHHIYTLELTVMASETQEYFFEVVVCENELPYVWNGCTITKAGLHLFEESLECGEARYILNLTVLPSDTIVFEEAYDYYEWHGKVYTESGQYQHYNGCGLEVLNLTIIKTPTKPEGDNCENAIQVNWNDEITICGSTDTWYAIDISGIWERGEDITTTFRNNSAETATITNASYEGCEGWQGEWPLFEVYKREVKSGEERTIVYDFDQLLDFRVYIPDDIIYLHIKNDGGCVTAPALWFWLPATEDVVE